MKTHFEDNKKLKNQLWSADFFIANNSKAFGRSLNKNLLLSKKLANNSMDHFLLLLHCGQKQLLFSWTNRRNFELLSRGCTQVFQVVKIWIGQRSNYCAYWSHCCMPYEWKCSESDLYIYGCILAPTLFKMVFSAMQSKWMISITDTLESVFNTAQTGSSSISEDSLKSPKSRWVSSETCSLQTTVSSVSLHILDNKLKLWMNWENVMRISSFLCYAI